MIPGQTESSHQVQNYSSASKTPTNWDLNWSTRLDKLLNNTDDQDDYFQIYSDASNTTISTICVKSNESRYTDSCWSDVTRTDDIVIELSERAFYNTKVNPFPQMKFPPTSSSKKKLSNIVETDHNTEDVDPADLPNEIMIDVRNNADEVVNGDDQKIEHIVSAYGTSNEKIEVLSNEGMALDDGLSGVVNNKDLASEDSVEIESKVTDAHSEDLTVGNEIIYKMMHDEIIDNQTTEELSAAHKVTNDDVTSANGIVTEVNNDQSEALACGLFNDFVDDQKIKDVVTAVINEDQNSKECSIPTDDVTDDVKDDRNDREMAPPIEDVTNGTDHQQNNVDLAAENNNGELLTTGDLTDDNVKENRNQQDMPPVHAFQSNSSAEVKTTASEQNAVASTSTKNNSTLEPRKKRYRKTVDNNHRKNVKHQLSKSSCCTNVTSTTTVQVTTNDDVIFDALADMPHFINSSVIELASSYIDERVRSRKNQRTRCIDFDSAFPSSSSSLAPSWRNERLSSIYDEYISPREAYKQLNSLLRDGTNENLKAVMYDEYNGLRIDDDIASSEDEFLSDVEDLNLTSANWSPPESEIRRQVAIILKKIHPLEDNYCTIINDMLSKYLNYIHSKQRIVKINRIVDCVNQPISQQEKTELLIRREFDDKKLNREFYHSSIEPPDFTELGERRRQAIIKKYTRCHNDRQFCYSYFKRSIDDRPVSKLGWRIAKLKQELELIFA